MNGKELINKVLWLGYTSAEESKEKRKEAINLANNLLEEYLVDFQKFLILDNQLDINLDQVNKNATIFLKEK